MAFLENIDKILEKYNELGEKLAGQLDPETLVKLSKEYAGMENIIIKINEYKDALRNIDDLKALSASDDVDDSELARMAHDEMIELQSTLPQLENNVKIALLPKEEDDSKNAIIELRAGTGGEEAALFASVLFNMYQRYAESRRWKFEILSISDTGIGGYKEASCLVSGHDVFARLKFESGVHRVQRIPETESSGRIHTSAATVAVLPEVADVDIVIDEKDLRIDTYRSSGAGGQHVNTTDSAVRITHIPTGVVVTQQDERSQNKNKAKAMKILRARIYDAERQKLDSERSSMRKTQVGSGDRSERIRTYNFPQGRVTDHRINMTLYRIADIVNNGELDEIIDALIANHEAEKLANLEI